VGVITAGVSSLGDDRLSYEIGVVEEESGSEPSKSGSGMEMEVGIGLPANAREALNFDVFERILGGGNESA